MAKISAPVAHKGRHNIDDVEDEVEQKRQLLRRKLKARYQQRQETEKLFIIRFEAT